ncbi:MAG TPA: CHAT domain-containing protein [Thermodesulfovibrionales bacterium]|nr:CHAT domain-containing protein [Thermodesulfovibrionales bacterium]
MRSFERGAFEEAVHFWKEAEELYEKREEIGRQSEALVFLSQAYQSLGLTREALRCLESAEILAQKSGDAVRIASALASLGNVYIATGPEDKANEYLNRSLAMAKELQDFRLSATILNNLGNLFMTQKKYREAGDAYQESITYATKFDKRSLTAIAATNAAMALVQERRYSEAKTLLDGTADIIGGLDDSHEKVYALINAGLTYADLRSHLPGEKDVLLQRSSQMFHLAVSSAEAIGDLRGESYALGYLGKLYEDERQYEEALGLTHRAVFTAQLVNVPESLYLWQWQAGRLLKAMGKIDDAIPAYRNALQTLQAIRQEMSQCYGRTKLSFRESVGPLYFEFVDLLLQRAAAMQGKEEYEPYLLEARETVESLKIAELRDYFQDDCFDVARTRITRLDLVSKTAVVVYPIVLQDRTELLVSLPSGLKRISVGVGERALAQEVRQFRSTLEKRTTREYLPHAQRLYDLLIRPLEPDLRQVTTDTLVFVPDGPLRTIPMAALHDGKEFLVEKYAIAVTPGLNLTDPRALNREQIKMLAAGLTDAVQGFPPLPDVSSELQALRGIYPGDILLNQNFLIASMEKELKDKQFSIVHIASHGQFESEISKTFLLTFDDKLTMDQLDRFIGFFRFRNEPLELLTLSACETAVGDDRAALGLAGVAVKAGARSALATLWHINDRAASLLVDEFYRQLQDPSVSRTSALRNAQRKLLGHAWYQHPGYWSPFLLINNWL